MLVIWFTVLLERWQISLNVPATFNAELSLWRRGVLTVLALIAYTLPTSRLVSAAVFALPFVIIPLSASWQRPTRIPLILVLASVVNSLFFISQLIIDQLTMGLPTQISVQGIAWLISYIMGVFILLIWTR